MTESSFLFLGTGASTGIPVVGCHCAVCRSRSALNRRLRPSGLIRLGKKTILIDCGPDFRQQALRYQIEHLDLLLITHAHYDHVAGIDDLRGLFFNDKRLLHCLVSPDNFKVLKKHYDYLLSPKNNKLRLRFHQIDDAGAFTASRIRIEYFSYLQCRMRVVGYRLGDFAYVTDICRYDDRIFDALRGVEQLVLSAVSNHASNAHLSISQAIAFAERVKAKAVWLTHIGHHVEHKAAQAQLPPHIQLGYDGLEFKISI